LVLIAPAETLVMPAGSGGLFQEIRLRLPAATQLEYDAYLARYLDFGTLFSKNERELTALNDELGRYYQLALESEGLTLPPREKSVPGGGWMVQAMYMSMGLEHDYRPALGRVTVPVLVVHGERDVQSEAASRLYADSFPNGEFRVIAGAGHFVFNDAPETFARTMGEFLERLP
jgi:pimeloyl-ACP methyl ester carboxylesterase